jgi:alpha-glucuronidase
MTFSTEDAVVKPVVEMMMGSHQAVVDYMTPLGLHHLMGTGHHYGPMPWDASGARDDWKPVYYHRANRDGIGFDRSSRGSNAVGQYAPPLAAQYDDLTQVPDMYLLWFHHVPWTHRMRSGRTLWEELVASYARGIDTVKTLRASWAKLEGRIDAERFAKTAAFLGVQQNEAQWWRDASIAYWQSLNGLPLPAGAAAPPHSLDHYKSLSFPLAPGR